MVTHRTPVGACFITLSDRIKIASGLLDRSQKLYLILPCLSVSELTDELVFFGLSSNKAAS